MNRRQGLGVGGLVVSAVAAVLFVSGCAGDTTSLPARGCDGGACSENICAGSSLPTLCSGECVNLQGNRRHCGECNHACEQGAVCRDGECVCPSSAPDHCNGQCVDVTHDSANCGQCGTACGATCQNGACLEVSELSLGGQHAVARLKDGSLSAWGYNGFGQLGISSRGAQLTPQALTAPANVLRVAAGRSHTCAVLPDGSVSCWGDNAFSQLVALSPIFSAAPIAIDGVVSAVAVSAGGRHSCALGKDGSVTCWGWNANGQLGVGKVDPLPPALAPAIGVAKAVQVALGANHTCVLVDGGNVLCWGDNADGQIGDGTTTLRSSPVPVPGISDVAEIAAGADRTCARTNAGTVSCWGRIGGPAAVDSGTGDGGGTGDAGVGIRKPSAVPGVSAATGLAAGDHHVCARLKDGTAVCWGDNDDGQLGDGTRIARAQPTAVSGAADVVEIAASGNHSCLRTSAGAVKCWGDNAQGEIGDGTTAGKTQPTGVAW